MTLIPARECRPWRPCRRSSNPLVVGHELLGGFHAGRVVALTVQVGADPAGSVPVDVFVSRIELRALRCESKAQTATPGAVAFLQRLVFAGDALGANGRDRRRPHGLDDHFAGCHEVDRFIEAFPEGAELTACLVLMRKSMVLSISALVMFALVGIFDVALGFHNHGGIHDADRWNVQIDVLPLKQGRECQPSW